MEESHDQDCAALVILALLTACSEIHSSDSEMSNVKSSQDDDKGGHPDQPIVE